MLPNFFHSKTILTRLDEYYTLEIKQVMYDYYNQLLIDSCNMCVLYINAQGRLNSIIGPHAKQCTGTHTYTTTRRNKTVNADKIKHIFIVLVLLIKSVFKH